jgi:hypothetical protein
MAKYMTGEVVTLAAALARPEARAPPRVVIHAVLTISFEGRHVENRYQGRVYVLSESGSFVDTVRDFCEVDLAPWPQNDTKAGSDGIS